MHWHLSVYLSIHPSIYGQAHYFDFGGIRKYYSHTEGKSGGFSTFEYLYYILVIYVY